ncbi:IS1634 family transposase [Paenibacillus koleovorans]|uniref:IS1634 family transposase n=1 Tax=Paenibacillus koleovorans TaxID=121608 RepID=UPI000FDBB640|nr:IS1634 family transposase [Paenibacillus koleovorans]
MSTPIKTYSYSSGPTVLMDRLCREIELEETLNELLAWDSKRCNLSPGARIKALILNVLSGKDPLVHVERFYRDQDVELLFGAGVTADDLNDDALARALDKLHEATPWKVYSTLAIRAMRKLGLPIGVLHNDTTSMSLHGAYEEEADLKIVHGHSKDHRPDLKQIMLGLAVSPERIPVLANVENGNTSDKTWNHTFIRKLRQTLSQEDWQQLLYVADSALITKRNLKYMKRLHLRFVSRLPDVFAVCEEVKQTAWASSGAWQEIGVLSQGPAAAQYRLQSMDRVMDGRSFRLIVVYSSNLDERKQRALESTIQKEEERLTRQIRKLEETEFHCESDARQALQGFQGEHRSEWFRWELTVEAVTRPAKRTGRGRPKKEEPSPMETVYVPKLGSFTREEAAVEAEKRLLSTFVLISNGEADRYSDTDLLRAYKGQDAAETRFRLLKDPQLVGGVYLKTPDRIEALGIVLVMALLLYGILEYRIRQQLDQQEKPFRVPGRSRDYKPTGQVLLLMLQQIKVLLIQYEDHRERLLTDNADDLARRVVEMAGYDMSIYNASPVEMTSC